MLHLATYFLSVLYGNRSDKIYLDHQTSLLSYTFGDIARYTVNGKFYVWFTVEAIDANAVPISDVSGIKLDSYRKSYNKCIQVPIDTISLIYTTLYIIIISYTS